MSRKFQKPPTPPQDPPRIFAVLLSLLGLGLVGVGLFVGAYLGGGEGYALFLGVGYVATGLLLYRGKRVAVTVYGIVLLVAWTWSLKEFRTEPLKLFYNVGMATLIGLYIFSAGLGARLEPEPTLSALREPLGEREALRAESLTSAMAAAIRFAPPVIAWIVLVYAAKQSLALFTHAAGGSSRLAVALNVAWILSPSLALFWATLRGGGNFLRDCGICFASLMLAAFGMGVYDINVSLDPEEQGGGVFLWVPLAQWAWVGGWMYLLNREG